VKGIVHRSRLTASNSQRRGVRADIVRTPLAWLIVASVVLAVSGCGGTSRARTATSASAGPSTRAPARNLSTQLWRFYRYAGREPGVADVIDRTEQVVEARCMRRAGFSYWPITEVHTGPPVLDDGLSDVPGVAPPKAAVLRIEKKQGYGLYAQVRSIWPVAAKANSKYFKSLSPAAQKKYQLAQRGNERSTVSVTFPNGTVEFAPKGGCLGQAANTVYGSVARDTFRMNAVAYAMHLVEIRVFAMPAIKLATKSWAVCMQKRSGHPFATPDDLFKWLMSQYYQHGVNRRTGNLEIRYSMMSTTCKYQTGMASRYANATWKVVSAMPDSWYRAIINARSWDASALVKARAILSSRS
jgi:hypothetical protein